MNFPKTIKRQLKILWCKYLAVAAVCGTNSPVRFLKTSQKRMQKNHKKESIKHETMENHTENAFWLCCIHDLCCSLLVEPHRSDRLSALLVCQVSMDSKSLIQLQFFCHIWLFWSVFHLQCGQCRWKQISNWTQRSQFCLYILCPCQNLVPSTRLPIVKSEVRVC